MSFEFPVNESSGRTSIPSDGMGKAFVKGEIPFIEILCFEFVGVCAVGRHIKNGDVEKINALAVLRREPEGALRCFRTFCRGAEKEVNIGCDPCSLQGLERPRSD